MTASLDRPLAIRMHPTGNAAVAANNGGLPAGAVLADGLALHARSPQGRKVALRDFDEGDPAIRNDVAIGYAARDIPQGAWIKKPLVRMPAVRELDRLPIATRQPPVLEPLTGYTFEGCRNAGGSVGARNILAIRITVPCAAGVADCAVRRIKAEILPKYPNVDDMVAIGHIYGCGVAIGDLDAVAPVRTIRNLTLNPNFGGTAMLVSLGCEQLQPSRLPPGGAVPIQASGEPCIVTPLEQDGFEAMIVTIMTVAETRLAELNRRPREVCPAADLAAGVQCGGSDAFSGVAANPAAGFAAGLLVRAGGTVMHSEVTEVRDAIGQMTARAASPEAAAALIREMQRYGNYPKRGGVDRSANARPGDRKGGLANSVERAMGSIVKSGASPIVGVLTPGGKVKQKGLIFAATPASDFICGARQLASGMNLPISTAGGGTPYGLAEAPVNKAATRDDLAERWHDRADVNASRIVTGEAVIEAVGRELLPLMLDVASGRKKTWAEHWKLHNALAVFNPPPATRCKPLMPLAMMAEAEGTRCGRSAHPSSPIGRSDFERD